MIVKTDKKLLINIETIIKDDNYLTIAYDLKKNELGYAEFNKLKNNELWLYHIKTYPENRNLGIGSALLDFVDYWAVQFDCNHIAGKYGPTSDYTAEFYDKNGYEIIELEYYHRLEKHVKKDAIINKIMQKYHQEPTIFVDKTEEIKQIVEPLTKSQETICFAKK